MHATFRTTGFAALAGLALTILTAAPAGKAEGLDGASQRISSLIRQRVASATPLDTFVDRLMPDVAELVLENPDPLMKVLQRVDVYRDRFQQQAERIRVLQAQAMDHKDTLLFQCLESQRRRAEDLAAGAGHAYRELLQGITDEDIERTRQALEMVALFPRLARELNAAKNECVGTLPGIYVENLPKRHG